MHYIPHNLQAIPSAMNQLPDSETLEQARKLYLYDASGQKVQFGDLLNTKGNTIVVFIRS